jgi:nucleoside-diphosphate-sugar epimerase
MSPSPSRARHTMLVAGAGGVVGAAAVEHFASLPDWDVVAVSRRRPPELPEGVTHLSLDLTDAAACRAAGAALSRVTHLMFAALYEKPDLIAGWRDPEQMAVNLAMLRNLLDALEASAPGLRHVSLMQGTKAYGGHVTPAPVPAKERWPRHEHENFYWLQEDLLRERQPRAAWVFTVLRPQIVFGYAVSSPMNIVAAIGAYAAVMRELGRPLAWPGGGRYINGGSDSRLIAQVAEWAGTHEIAANETYNVVNGDALLWQDLWGSVAAHFGMPTGPDAPMNLTREMPAQADAWRRVVERHGLRDVSLDGLVGSSWQFTDRAFAQGLANPADSVLSGIKLHQHGFHGVIDTEDGLLHWLERMQAQRLLPR